MLWKLLEKQRKRLGAPLSRLLSLLHMSLLPLGAIQG